MAAKPKLAVFKFASCDGCQLSLLDAEDELLTVVDKVDVAYFLDRLDANRDSDLNAAEAAHATEVLLAAYRSAASGEVVQLPLPRGDKASGR